MYTLHVDAVVLLDGRDTGSWRQRDTLNIQKFSTHGESPAPLL